MRQKYQTKFCESWKYIFYFPKGSLYVVSIEINLEL